MTDHESSDASEALAIDMRKALTLAKGWSQILLRRDWRLDEADHRLLMAGLVEIDRAATRLAEDLAKLWATPDGAAPSSRDGD